MVTEYLDGHRYCRFGSGDVDLVIEMGLGTSLGEWRQVAQTLSAKHNVLAYERSRDVTMERTPKNIAKELHTLLADLGCKEKIILVAHSQGGLYASQFARLYPDAVKGLVLIDPLSPNDNEYKSVLTTDEQKKSGFDKSANLVVMQRLAKMRLGFIIKAVMKKAPPFYYYNGFTPEEREDILSALEKPEMYAAALAEYSAAHDENNLKQLKSKDGFPQIPLVLLTHTSEFSIKEIMEFGRTDRPFAEKVEDLWQTMMKVYLTFTQNATHIQAENSGHYMHLTEPGLIKKALSLMQ